MDGTVDFSHRPHTQKLNESVMSDVRVKRQHTWHLIQQRNLDRGLFEHRLNPHDIHTKANWDRKGDVCIIYNAGSEYHNDAATVVEHRTAAVPSACGVGCKLKGIAELDVT